MLVSFFFIGWSRMSGRRTSGTSKPSLGAQVFAVFSFIFLWKSRFKSCLGKRLGVPDILLSRHPRPSEPLNPTSRHSNCQNIFCIFRLPKKETLKWQKSDIRGLSQSDSKSDPKSSPNLGPKVIQKFHLRNTFWKATMFGANLSVQIPGGPNLRLTLTLNSN